MEQARIGSVLSLGGSSKRRVHPWGQSDAAGDVLSVPRRVGERWGTSHLVNAFIVSWTSRRRGFWVRERGSLRWTCPTSPEIPATMLEQRRAPPIRGCASFHMRQPVSWCNFSCCFPCQVPCLLLEPNRHFLGVSLLGVPCLSSALGRTAMMRYSPSCSALSHSCSHPVYGVSLRLQLQCDSVVAVPA